MCTVYVGEVMPSARLGRDVSPGCCRDETIASVMATVGWRVLVVGSGLDAPGRGVWACMLQVGVCGATKAMQPQALSDTPALDNLFGSLAVPIRAPTSPPAVSVASYRFKPSRSRCPRVMAYVRTRLCFHHSPALLPMSAGLEVPMPYCVSVGKAFWEQQLQPILPDILSSQCILPTLGH